MYADKVEPRNPRVLSVPILCFSFRIHSSIHNMVYHIALLIFNISKAFFSFVFWLISSYVATHKLLKTHIFLFHHSVIYFLIEFKFYKDSLFNFLYLHPPLKFYYVLFSLNGKLDNLIYIHLHNNGY